MLQRIVFSLVLFLSIYQTARGQDVATGVMPVQVKFIRTIELVRPDGSLKLVQKIQEYYARDSKGSEYRKNELIDLNTEEATPWLTSVASVPEGTKYEIIIPRKIVVLSKNPVKLKTFRPQKWPSDVRREVYLGRTCVVEPVTGASSGETWFDEVAHFPAYIQLKENSPEGKLIKTVRATELITGIEPNPELFHAPAVPQGYEVKDLRVVR
ncbi:MAG TPA: hypothetical protein VGQ81_06855 [Acidobacteriota bacterium]|jgi:hypothetical protein|nr:hypothetical protein [Acidobacteriota bacterium]